jgi:hypothetical protein
MNPALFKKELFESLMSIMGELRVVVDAIILHVAIRPCAAVIIVAAWFAGHALLKIRK